MAAIAADALVVIDKRLFADKADGFHWAAFDAGAAGNAPIPDDFGSDGIRIFKERLQKLLMPWHRVQTEISGCNLGLLKIRYFHLGQVRPDDFNVLDTIGMKAS